LAAVPGKASLNVSRILNGVLPSPWLMEAFELPAATVTLPVAILANVGAPLKLGLPVIVVIPAELAVMVSVPPTVPSVERLALEAVIAPVPVIVGLVIVGLVIVKPPPYAPSVVRLADVPYNAVIVADVAVITRFPPTVPSVERLALEAVIAPVPVIVGLVIVGLVIVKPAP
jgi:hypothetical protein